MDRYAVMGNPVKHSKSPDIHRLFAEQTHQQLSYDKMLVEKEAFAEEVSAFFALEGKGLNITVPFKEDAYDYVDLLTERAKLAKAVNTLIGQDDGSVIGDNTDGAGLVGDLRRLRWPLKGARILLIGAGGAARGVLLPLLEQGLKQLTIVNRTASKASALAEEFAQFGQPYIKLVGCGFADLKTDETYDIIINATSASLAGERPAIPDALISKKTYVYDMMYAAEPTTFLAWASASGAKATSDGLGMLVGQAAESFYQWRHVRPNVEPVIKALREDMSPTNSSAA